MKLASAPTRSEPARQDEPPIVRNRVPGGHPSFFSGGFEIYGNYLDEVWTLDDRSGGISVADLNDGAGNDRHFYHQNTLFHVYGLTDEAANLVEAYQYDAYGKQTVITDGNDGDSIVNFSGNDVRTVGGNSTVSNPYMYGGYRFDPETGTYYVKRRYFFPDLGRWATRDPIGYEDSPNLYEYVISSPTALIDAMGLSCDPVPPPKDYACWSAREDYTYTTYYSCPCEIEIVEAHVEFYEFCGVGIGVHLGGGIPGVMFCKTEWICDWVTRWKSRRGKALYREGNWEWVPNYWFGKTQECDDCIPGRQIAKE